MIALGVMAVVLAVVSAYHANRFDPAEFQSVPEARKQLDEQIALVESLGLSLRGVWLFSAALTLGVGAVMGALGFGVRAGRMVPVVLSIMLAAVVLLFMALALLGGIVQGVASGSPAVLLQSCFPFAIAGAMVLLLVWLIRAARAAPRIAYARQVQEYQAAYQRQARQYFQQQSSAPQQGGPAQTQATPPPAATGGYHQYPVPPAAPPAAAPPGAAVPRSPELPPVSPSPGDHADGPPPQG
jgi:hypothetical protein